MDEIKAIPRNRYLGMLADALGGVKNATGPVGDFLIGDAPRTLDQWSYGFSPVRFGGTGQGLAGALYGMKVDPGLVDVAGVAGMLPGAGRAAGWAGKEALRAIDGAMLGGGNQALARALSGIQARGLIAPDDLGQLYHRSQSPVMPEIDPNKGRFGSIFATQEPPPSAYGPNLHEYLAKGPIMENADVSDFLSSPDGISWLRTRFGKTLPDDEINDLAWMLADEQNALGLGAAPNRTPEQRLMDAFGAVDESDLYAELQRARANIARDQGMGGVTANDEFGNSFQLVK